MAKSWKIHFNWLQFLLIILLALGIFFRFVNLDYKVYWVDETATSLRISGYTFADVGKLISTNSIVTTEDLQRYQRTNPDKNVINTIQGLAVEEPQHPPLYFVMARIWVQWFGNSVAVTRSLSALFSLLVFPCLYWLCLELFERSLVGWVAIALIAVSPFHVLYAQEARQYSLWTVTILLSSAALLRAMRLKSKLSWGIYAATLALSFYTFVLSGLVAIGHGIYVLITENFRLRKTFNAYLLSTFAGFIVFMPWVFVVITNLSSAIDTLAWTLAYRPKPVLIQMWVLNIIRIFADFHYGFIYQLAWLYAFIVIFVGYSIYFLCCHTPKKVWLFVLTLIGSTGGILSIADLIINGGTSTVTRYFIPSLLGIHLAVAYFLATQITFVSAKNTQMIFWRFPIVLLTLIGVLSSAFISQQNWWWNKYWTTYLPDIAPIVNQAKNPLFITSNFTDLGSLSYLFSPKVHVQLVDNKDFVMPNGNIRCQPSIFAKYNNFSDIFLLVPKLSTGQEDISETNSLQSELEKKDNCEMELVRKWYQEIEPDYSVKASLWKLKK